MNKSLISRRVLFNQKYVKKKSKVKENKKERKKKKVKENRKDRKESRRK